VRLHVLLELVDNLVEIISLNGC